MSKKNHIDNFFFTKQKTHYDKKKSHIIKKTTSLDKKSLLETKRL